MVCLPILEKNILLVSFGVLSEIRLPFRSESLEDFHRLLVDWVFSKCGYDDVKVYIQLTRGVAPRDHGFPVKCRTDSISYLFGKWKPLPIEMMKEGSAR